MPDSIHGASPGPIPSVLPTRCCVSRPASTVAGTTPMRTPPSPTRPTARLSAPLRRWVSPRRHARSRRRTLLARLARPHRQGTGRQYAPLVRADHGEPGRSRAADDRRTGQSAGRRSWEGHLSRRHRRTRFRVSPLPATLLRTHSPNETDAATKSQVNWSGSGRPRRVDFEDAVHFPATPSGSTLTLTADRACRPASPKISRP